MDKLKLLLFLCLVQFSAGVKAFGDSDAFFAGERDTIVYNELNWSDQQLVELRGGRYGIVPYSQIGKDYPYKVYLARDTSLFNGFLLYEQRENPYVGYFLVTTWDFKDGSPTSMTTYHFVAKPDTMNHQLFPFYHFNSAFQWKGSVCDKLTDWMQSGVMFFPDGDTSMVFTGTNNGRSSETKFYKNGDTLSHSKKEVIDGIEISTGFERYKNGELSQYHRTEYVDGVYSSILWYSFDPDRDTTNFRKVENGIEHNIKSIRSHTGKLLKIRTILENDKLKDIENKNILYLNNAFEIVSKEMFIQLNENSEGYFFDELYQPVYSAQGERYELMFYPRDANFQSKKYGRKLNKYARASAKRNPNK